MEQKLQLKEQEFNDKMADLFAILEKWEEAAFETIHKVYDKFGNN